MLNDLKDTTMKKLFLSLMLSMAAFVAANAMSFERARAEALYLTDKMAYELNLNDQQYNDAYEINLDYFLRLDSPSDVYGSYYDYRLYDLRHILHDWQYNLFVAADYFLRPVVWRASGWYFPIYGYYDRSYFYYSRPVVWRTYYGGHSRHYYHGGYYANRRPHWNGGLRGHDMYRPSVGSHHVSSGRGLHGNGYHIDFDNHRNAGSHMNHGGGYGNVNHGGSHSSGNGYVGSSSVNHGNGSGSMNHGSSHGGSSYGSGRSHSDGGSIHRGNSFDGSSSRMSGASRGSSIGVSRGGASYGGSSRGSANYGGSSRGSSSISAGSRGGGANSRGGSVSRGGRR